MPKYKATDPTTGKVIRFDWQGEAPPTDADIDEIVGSAGKKISAGAGDPPSDEFGPLPEPPPGMRRASGSISVEPPRAMRPGGVPEEELDSSGQMGEMVKSFGRLVRSDPATVGGMVGSAVGTPLGPWGQAGLATLGGAGGEGIKIVDEALTQGKVSPSMGEDWNRMAKAGAIQGGPEALMHGAGKGLQKVGTEIYGGLLGATGSLKNEFGDIAQHAVDRMIPIGKKAATKLDEALTAQTQKIKDLVAQAKAAGAPNINPVEILDAWRDTIQTLKNRQKLGQVSGIPEAIKRAQRMFTEMGPGGVDVVEGQVLKKTAQDSADVARRLEERGAKALNADDMLDAATAKGFQGALEKRIPTIAGENKNSREMLGILEALQAKNNRSPLAIGGARDLIAGVGGLTAGLGSGDASTGVGVAALLRALSMPSVGSRAAIGMNTFGKHVLPKVPQAARAAKLYFTRPEDEEQ